MNQKLYKLRIPEIIADLIKGMHPHLKKKIKNSLEIILNDPLLGKSLKEELTGLRSFRTGKFKIIYKITKEIQLIAVGPRSKIYEETYKIIKSRNI